MLRCIELPFEDNTFDGVAAVSVLCFFLISALH